MREKPFKLPKEFAEKWLIALRSGEYAQGRAHLYNDGGYCCIGVAGRICGLSENEVEFNDNDDFFYTDDAPEGFPEELIYVNESNDLPGILSGLNDGTVKKLDSYPEGTLFVENASSLIGYSFNEIADFIELNTEFYE